MLLVLLGGMAGCQRAGPTEDAKEITLAVSFRPDPPAVGSTVVSVVLTRNHNQAVTGAMVKLEGNMTHAGMKPEFADAREAQPGHYEATLDFTMAGDWFLLVQANLADGRKLSRKVNVPGVKSR